MRRFCQHSQRWHQQFCHSLRSSHQRCLIQTSSAQQARQRFRPRGDQPAQTQDQRARAPNDDLVVREYDQVGPGEKDVVRSSPQSALKETTERVKNEIKRLEHELAVLREGPFGPNSDFMKSLPPEERAKALKIIKESGRDTALEEDLLTDEEFTEILEDDDEPDDKLAAIPKVTIRIPAQQRAYVKQFNNALQASSTDQSTPLDHLTLWKSYLRCERYVPGFSGLIPEDVWQILWESQSTALDRSHRLAMLSKDMIAAKALLSPDQWVTYIESLYLSSDTADAVKLWEEQRSVLGPETSTAEKFWSLGVHIYASLGRPQKAQRIAFDCLDHGSFARPQILVPVIAAWARSRNPSAQKKAWTCYLRLKSELGDKITIEDYEKVSTLLLKEGKADLALAVFKDMMLAQESSSADSKAVYDRALDYVADLQSRAVSEENVNRISLAALLVFPKTFENKFFYGSWIKKLIGGGEVDAAASVVELMYERGVKPDAKHLNGIIGAWLRKGSPESRDRAEQMAWAMIERRIALVDEREGRARPLSALEKTLSHHPRRIPAFLKRAAPPATIETFSILLLHYSSTSQPEAAEHLTHTMTGPAQIRPNSYIMNHWLYSALRKSDLQAVWDKYRALSADIHPDLETFACLWDTAKIQYDKSRSAHAKDFPSARLLYAEMLNWFSGLPPHKQKRARDTFSRALYGQVVRCFCLSSDLHGLLCALHGLQHAVAAYPDSNTSRMAVIAVSRLAGTRPTRATGARSRATRSSDAVAEVTALLDAVAEAKTQTLYAAGRDPDGLSEQELSENLLLVLSEFIVLILRKLEKATGSVRNEVRTVAKVMGVDVGGVDFDFTIEEE